jgi:subtilisin family serine protease
MKPRNLSTPWAPASGVYSLPGSMMLKLRLGEAPEHVPTQLDVRSRAVAPATKIDGGVIDRLIRHYANGALVTRVHGAAASLGKRGALHCGFNDEEQISGLSRTFRLDMDRGSAIERLVAALSEVSIVEHASPNFISRAPFSAVVSPPLAIDIQQAWESRDAMYAREAMAYEPGDPGLIVAIVDSGVSRHHPEMSKRFRSGFDTVQLGSSDFAPGVTLLGDVAQADTKPIDKHVGHGMACAGIIGAIGNGMPAGLAGDCALLPIRVLGAAKLPAKTEAVGLGAITDIDMGVKMAVDLGARVINMSFGTADDALEPGVPKPHADVVSYAAARGCVLVAASGNSGKEEIYWPAAYENVIAVGSIAVADAKPSHFTTRGSHVALCAVGERVATCSLDGYQLATGTSFAAPFVAAAAALIVSRAQRRSYPVSGSDVRRILTESATPWPASRQADFSGYGAGILNVAAALATLDQEIDRSQSADTELGVLELNND